MRMEKRWYDFWSKGLGSDRDSILAVRSGLFGRYKESGRAYHNLQHIEFCLAELDRCRFLAQNMMVVEAAIWFHDAIYDTERKDNEERSAQLAEEEMKRLGSSDDFIQAVCRAIRATDHKIPVKEKPDYLDDRITCDIDLASLGQSWDVVEAHNAVIREEYKWVPIKEYCSVRAKILQSFLDRPQIYYLPEFRERYESQARENLTRSIHELI